MEAYAWILLQKLSHVGSLVSREIVEDDMDLLASRAQGNDFLQKGYEVLTCVARGGLSMNTTGGGIQCRIQRERSMAVVFKPTSFDAAGRKRQNRVEPIQRLGDLSSDGAGTLRYSSTSLSVFWIGDNLIPESLPQISPAPSDPKLKTLRRYMSRISLKLCSWPAMATATVL